ncbi:unnamed protein product, partial [Dovyalis caffra]
MGEVKISQAVHNWSGAEAKSHELSVGSVPSHGSQSAMTRLPKIGKPRGLNLVPFCKQKVQDAYANVGLSTGYSRKRQLEPDNYCKDEWFGYVGRWNNMGQCILIIVMFFGRLKKFSMNGCKAILS